MKRAERLAWLAVGGLLTIAVILIAGAFTYRVTSFWAGAMLVCGQAVVVGLAAWGLGLARQAKVLREIPAGGIIRSQTITGGDLEASGATSGFRMSVGDDSESTRSGGPDANEEARTLDVGFQRVLVGTTGVVLVGMATLMTWALAVIYNWYKANPDKQLGVAGSLDNPIPMDELCLLIGLACAAIYGVLYWITRPAPETEGYGEATSSSFTLGITGMAALGIGTLLAYFKVVWAGETAAAIIAALLALQGLELLVNSFRSYSGIDELDLEAVDLQTTPLTPMLMSVWLAGLRMLFAQSVGLHEGDKKGERGVIARMMPRTLLAILLLAIGASCLRVVRPGQVAILERLGYTPLEEDGRRPKASAILHAGLHVTYPWPIDELVYIPTEQLQEVDVGTELHASGEWKNVDFQFWMLRPEKSNENEGADLFITGDPGSPQFLETYVQVRWRVADAARFYAAFSHSEFLEKGGMDGESRKQPIYEALIQQSTQFAVTRTFAIHTLEQIMITQRAEVELHCRKILQDKLDELCRLPDDKAGEPSRGIEVSYLSIKDLHPPKQMEDKPNRAMPVIGGKIQLDEQGLYTVVDDPQQTSRTERGPASAFELVVSMREFKEQLINVAERDAIAVKAAVQGEAQSAIANAEADKINKIAQATGEAGRLTEMTNGKSPEELELLRRKLFFDTFQKLFDPVTKVVVDPEVKDVQIIQVTENSTGTFRPTGP